MDSIPSPNSAVSKGFSERTSNVVLNRISLRSPEDERFEPMQKELAHQSIWRRMIHPDSMQQLISRFRKTQHRRPVYTSDDDTISESLSYSKVSILSGNRNHIPSPRNGNELSSLCDKAEQGELVASFNPWCLEGRYQLWVCLTIFLSETPLKGSAGSYCCFNTL